MRGNRNLRAAAGATRLLTVLGLLLWLGAAGAFAQSATNWEPGKKMRLAVGNVITSANKVIQQVREKNGVTLGYSALGAFMGASLGPGQSAHEGFEFKAGVQYAIIICGDDRLQRMSMDFRHEGGGHVPGDAQIDNRGNKGIIVFRPKQTARYRIVVGVVEATGNKAFVGMSLLQEGGVAASTETLNTISEQCLLTCDAVYEANLKSGLIYDFYNGDKTWAVFAVFLEPNDGARAVNSVLSDAKDFAANDYALITATDNGLKEFGFGVRKAEEVPEGESPFLKADMRNLSDAKGPRYIAFFNGMPGGRYMVQLENLKKAEKGTKETPRLAMAATLSVVERKPVPPPKPKPDEKPAPDPAPGSKAVALKGDWTNDANQKSGPMVATLDGKGKISGRMDIEDKFIAYTGSYTLTGGRLQMTLETDGTYTYRGTLDAADGKTYSGVLRMYKEDEVVARIKVRLTTATAGGGGTGNGGSGGDSGGGGTGARILSFRLTGDWKNKGDDDSGTMDWSVDLPAGNRITGKMVFSDDSSLKVTGTVTAPDDASLVFDLKIGDTLTGKLKATFRESEKQYAGTLFLYRDGKEVRAMTVTLTIRDVKRETK